MGLQDKKNGKKIVLNGVGTAYLSSIVGGKPTYTKCGTLQNLKISINASDEKVYGGDALTPIYIITKDTSVNISATEAVFDLEYLQLTSGATMDNKGNLMFSVEPTLISSGTSFTVPGSLTTIDPTSVICMLSDDAEGLVNVENLKYNADAPSSGEFKIEANGTVTLGKSVTKKYITLNGFYASEGSRKASIGTASVPGFVEIRHVSMPVDMGDGKKVRLHTRIYKARSTGKMEIDHKRQSASTPELEFEVMYDSNRSDDRIMEISQEIMG